VVDPTLVRAASLLIPLGLTLGLLGRRRPDRRLAAAAFLASAWALTSLLAVNLLAFRLGWWSFEARGGLFMGMPVDLWLGWALLWGAVPILAFRRARLWLLGVAIAWIDLIVMPASAPVVELGPSWLLGEAVAIAACFVPAQLIGGWTRDGRRLAARSAAQVVLFAAISLWLLPSIILDASGAGWPAAPAVPGFLLGPTLQLLAVPAVLGAAAVLELAERGGGTPFPWDPPSRLVASGPYAYVANPMQLSMTVLMASLGVLLGSAPVALAGLVAGAFGAGFARWQEAGDLEARFGAAWHDYRAAVRPWLPTWRPARLAPATLYFAESCAECSEVGAWFRRRAPTALELRPAERYPGPSPTRITYATADGRVFTGVAALARAVDQLNLGWAWVGWALRLPGACQAAQLLADALGAGPRAIPTRGR
jgi:protein-S-isoprenylcysteine O-methyltransferase Ste14